MDEKELDEALKSLDYPIRYYQRLIAMKLISVGHNHKETGEKMADLWYTDPVTK